MTVTTLNRFRELCSITDLVLLANIWDAGTARLAESLGAHVIGTTSAGLAWSNGYADGAVLPLSVHAKALERIVEVVRCPVTADVENGYTDDPQTAAQNVAQLIDCGISGINIEDGDDDPDLLCRKIEAIKQRAAKSDIDLFINARTDVYLRQLSSEPVTETLFRAKLYKDAGADGLFVPGLGAEDEIAKIVSEQSLPINVMAVPALPSIDVLKSLGVRRLSAGAAIAQKAWALSAAHFDRFQQSGSDAQLFDGAADYQSVQSVFG